jgi:UDP:flavonoid glycosyltransferase YjiC (YdhE family)
LPVSLPVATAGPLRLGRLPPNVRAADDPPGALAVRRAGLVVCNGGSTTACQDLEAEVPVPGVPCKLDQYLSMSGVAAVGAGLSLRSGTLRPGPLREAVCRMLGEPAFRNAAGQAADELAAWPARRDAFGALLREALAR